MANQQATSFDVPLDEFILEFSAAVFEFDSASKLLVEQFLAQDTQVESDSSAAVSLQTEWPSNPPPFSESLFPPTDWSHQSNHQSSAHPSSPTPFHPWLTTTNPHNSSWTSSRAPVFKSNYPSSFMEPLSGNDTQSRWGSTHDPTLSEFSSPIPACKLPMLSGTTEELAVPSIQDAWMTTNEVEAGIYDNRPYRQLSRTPISSNRDVNKYSAFSNTLGEGLEYHLESTDNRQTVTDPRSRDSPVEQSRSEPNANGSREHLASMDSAYNGLYALTNALGSHSRAYESMEKPHGTKTEAWTNTSMDLPLASEQPTANTSQVRGHIPNCMGGLGVSVTPTKVAEGDIGGYTRAILKSEYRASRPSVRAYGETTENEGDVEGSSR
ncbi:hypothetical protein JR316_0002916 [Psilocybe cubensis]|uniref:Uncharacterized protein n=1 Tax=Psilocybe cubensis TaxID=181762 RepID=A0ACB8H6N4_PSICU|nr:hypothetical protein JR316_0002916 [Psilocybe cubensis]KAH9483448.1 hypothetical protein JR316_0002916 [Psilocybe cubensis]